MLHGGPFLVVGRTFRVYGRGLRVQGLVHKLGRLLGRTVVVDKLQKVRGLLLTLELLSQDALEVLGAETLWALGLLKAHTAAGIAEG